ncbi:hypothetical protein F5Y15DRAFT_29265 [Xylariaceae sp. FL0016]|nr:hypothetical protein F5Y15DRAFT_29265 [Xylariaceae sp. FL0016]
MSPEAAGPRHRLHPLLGRSGVAMADVKDSDLTILILVPVSLSATIHSPVGNGSVSALRAPPRPERSFCSSSSLRVQLKQHRLLQRHMIYCVEAGSVSITPHVGAFPVSLLPERGADTGLVREMKTSCSRAPLSLQLPPISLLYVGPSIMPARSYAAKLRCKAGDRMQSWPKSAPVLSLSAGPLTIRRGDAGGPFYGPWILSGQRRRKSGPRVLCNRTWNFFRRVSEMRWTRPRETTMTRVCGTCERPSHTQLRARGEGKHVLFYAPYLRSSALASPSREMRRWCQDALPLGENAVRSWCVIILHLAKGCRVYVMSRVYQDCR